MIAHLCSEQDVRDALSHIPSDERTLWVQMGYAIHDALGADAGWAVFDEWSQKSEAYIPSHAKSVWRSVCKPGAITAASLFHTARQYGYQGSPRRAQLSPEEVEARKRAREAEERRIAEEVAAAERKRDYIMGRLHLGTSPYLVSKGFDGDKARGYLYKGITILPYRNLEGKVQSLQFIDEEGEKRFSKWLPFSGSFVRMGAKRPDVWIICEGYATGKTLLEAAPEAQVIVAGSAYNSYVVSRHFPNAIMAIDHDYWTCQNPEVEPELRHRFGGAWEQTQCPMCGHKGLTPPAGEEYARKSGLVWVRPPVLGDDFNDEWQTAKAHNCLSDWMQLTRRRFDVGN